MKGWLILVGAAFLVFGVYVGSAGFFLFGIMFIALGALAYVVERARRGEEVYDK